MEGPWISDNIETAIAALYCLTLGLTHVKINYLV